MSSSAPFVAIVISAYNAAGTLRVCLDSLKKQNYPGNKFQVIVVNDGSTDGTGKLFQKMHLPENFALIEYTENRGLATARNTGISKATGEIFIFLDADLEVAPDFIERHVSHFQKSEVIGVVGEIHPAPENPYDKYQRYLYEGRRGARACHNQQALPYKVFLFNATSLRRSAIEQVGLFDENIRSYGGEDTEMAFRLWQKFPRGLFYDPEIKVIHHHYRSLPQVLKTVEIFGRQVVPYLAKKNPKLAAEYGGKYFLEKQEKRPKLRHWLGHLWRTEAIFRSLWFLYEIAPFPFSNCMVRGLLASALLRGWASKK